MWGTLRHPKAWVWAEHPSAVRLVTVLHLGVSEWYPRLWHFWGRNSLSKKCQWATPLNVRLTEVWCWLAWINAANEIWLSPKIKFDLRCFLNWNFDQWNHFSKFRGRGWFGQCRSSKRRTLCFGPLESCACKFKLTSILVSAMFQLSVILYK